MHAKIGPDIKLPFQLSISNLL